MKSEKQFAQLWQQIAAKRKETEPTAEITLPGFEDFPFIGRRVPVEGWALSGRIPISLALEVVKSKNVGASEDALAEQRVGDAEKAKAFYRDLVTAAVVEPKIVAEGEPGEGEISYAWLVENYPKLAHAIVLWQMEGAPGVPVLTTGGETTVEAVRSFRERPGGQPAPSVSDHLSEVWPDSQPTIRPV